MGSPAVPYLYLNLFVTSGTPPRYVRWPHFMSSLQTRSSDTTSGPSRPSSALSSNHSLLTHIRYTSRAPNPAEISFINRWFYSVSLCDTNVDKIRLKTRKKNKRLCSHDKPVGKSSLHFVLSGGFGRLWRWHHSCTAVAPNKVLCPWFGTESKLATQARHREGVLQTRARFAGCQVWLWLERKRRDTINRLIEPFSPPLWIHVPSTPQCLQPELQ